eukprot:8174585-Pyramimonas_sp.AAC.1
MVQRSQCNNGPPRPKPRKSSDIWDLLSAVLALSPLSVLAAPRPSEGPPNAPGLQGAASRSSGAVAAH